MRMTDEQRRQMVANRPGMGTANPPHEVLSPRPPSFAPIGYVTHEHVLDAVARHLFGNVPDDEAAALPDAEKIKVIRECLNHLRQLLFARKLDAFYVSRMEEPPMRAIEPSFWGRDVADRALLAGQYDTDFEGVSAIFFKDVAIDAALNDGSPAGDKPANSGGRPSLQPAVRAAYWEIYPQGHGVEGHGWKVVAASIGERVGQSVSEDTVQRALKGG